MFGELIIKNNSITDDGYYYLLSLISTDQNDSKYNLNLTIVYI